MWVLYSTLSRSTHITKVCATAFYHLHNLSGICLFLSAEDIRTLVQLLFTSLLDYCNSLLYGLPAFKLDRIRVFNAAATLVCCAPCHSSITPLLLHLHWLPVKQWIQFQSLLFAFKAIQVVTPPYFSELVTIKEHDAYNLCSSNGTLFPLHP